MKLTFEVTLSVKPTLDFLQLAEKLPARLVEEMKGDMTSALTGYPVDSIDGLDITLAEIRPMFEVEEDALPDPDNEPTWDMLPRRLQTLLRDIEAYPSPRAAYERGQDYLITMLDGFGPASWRELRALFE